jgi:hypothetical protein
MRTTAVVVLLVASGLQLSARLQTDAIAACRVTLPNGISAGASDWPETSHGNARLSVGLSADGTTIFRPGGSGFVTPEGFLGMKFLWQRATNGTLHVSGRRVDGPASPLLIETSSNDGDNEFQPSYLIFPTPGCWEVTAKLGTREDSAVTFITNVIKIGDGPVARRTLARR